MCTWWEVWSPLVEKDKSASVFDLAKVGEASADLRYFYFWLAKFGDRDIACNYVVYASLSYCCFAFWFLVILLVLCYYGATLSNSNGVTLRLVAKVLFYRQSKLFLASRSPFNL